MSGGLLSASLICGALGLALARDRASGAARAALACAVAAAAGAVALHAPEAASPLRLAGWASLAVTAAAGLRGASWPWSLPLALNAGIWAGSATGPTVDVLGALAWLLTVLPARLLVGAGHAIALRVAASWLLTIGVLNAAIPIVTPTPGYVRDHME